MCSTKFLATLILPPSLSPNYNTSLSPNYQEVWLYFDSTNLNLQPLSASYNCFEASYPGIATVNTFSPATCKVLLSFPHFLIYVLTVAKVLKYPSFPIKTLTPFPFQTRWQSRENLVRSSRWCSASSDSGVVCSPAMESLAAGRTWKPTNWERPKISTPSGNKLSD